MTWPVRAGALPPLADGFSARPETAPGLRAALAQGAAVALVPSQKLAGTRSWLGSAGKTQLAAAAAESVWQVGGVDFLAWINATSRASVLAGYVDAAVTAMGIPADGDAEAVAVRFLRWLDEIPRPWLIVLDDLTDGADLEGLWPSGTRGRVLITATDPATVAGLGRATLLPVEGFSPREGLSYLMGRLTADPDQRLGAIDLTEDLGFEPLALVHASAVIATSAQTCRDYRDHFLRRRDQFTGASGVQPAAAAVTWTLSIDHAERLSPGVVEPLLALGALLDPNGIPAGLFTTPAASGYVCDGAQDAVDAPKRAWDGIVSLERAGLLAVDQTGGLRTVRISAMVQAAVRSAMPDKMFDQAARAAADALLEVWPDTEPAGLLGLSLRSCALSLQQATGDLLWDGGCHPLLMRAGLSLDRARLTGPAVSHWRQLAETGDRILGPGHLDTLEAGHRLASAYLAAKRADEAVSSFQWLLSSRGRVVGSDHPSVIALQIDLGRALLAAGQQADAITVLEQATTHYERIRGAEHPDTLAARDELAAAYCTAGRYASAIPVYRRTLADRERLFGTRHPDTITSRQRLGDAFLGDGQVKQAISQHKKAAADWERVAGPGHLDTLAARSALASAYYAAGRMAMALQLFEQAREDSERLLGEDHPDTLARRASLAHTYYSVGRLTDSKSLLADTVTRCERVLPPGDPLTKAVRDSLERISDR